MTPEPGLVLDDAAYGVLEGLVEQRAVFLSPAFARLRRVVVALATIACGDAADDTTEPTEGWPTLLAQSAPSSEPSPVPPASLLADEPPDQAGPDGGSGSPPRKRYRGTLRSNDEPGVTELEEEGEEEGEEADEEEGESEDEKDGDLVAQFLASETAPGGEELDALGPRGWSALADALSPFGLHAVSVRHAHPSVAARRASMRESTVRQTQLTVDAARRRELHLERACRFWTLIKAGVGKIGEAWGELDPQPEESECLVFSQSVLLQVLRHLSTPDQREGYRRLKAAPEKPVLAKRIVNAGARESYTPNKPRNDAAQQQPPQPASLQAEGLAATHAVAALFGPRGPAAPAPAPARSSRTPADLASSTMLPRAIASGLEMLHAMDEADYDETLGGGFFYVRRGSSEGAKPTLYYASRSGSPSCAAL
jgi:hypothetical protein